MKLGRAIKLNKDPMIDIEDDKEYSILGVQSYGQGVIIRRKVYGKNLKMKKYKVAKQNQLMWCKVDTKKGTFGVVRKEHEGCLASINMALADIDTHYVIPEFVELLFRNPFFYKNIDHKSTGTTNRKYLTPTQLCTEVEIPDLGLDEQALFVSKYKNFESSKLHSNIEKNRKYVQLLRESILIEATSGKLILENSGGESKSGLIKKVNQHKTKLSKKRKMEKKNASKVLDVFTQIPEHWLLINLHDVVDVVRGGSPRPAGSKEFYDGHIPFLKVADLTSDNEMYLTSYTTTIKKAGLKKTRFVNAHTLLLTNSGATLGVPKICTFDTTFNDGIAAFLNIPDFVDVRYLYYFLKSRTNWFRKFLSQGQGQPNLNTTLIGNTQFALPPLTEQKQIVMKVHKLLNLCDELEKKITENRKKSKLLLESILKEVYQ